MALKFPLMTLKVMAGIHIEAVRLWLKKAPYFRTNQEEGCGKKNAWPNGGHCKNIGSKMSIALRPISAILDRSPGKVAHTLQTALPKLQLLKLTRSIKKGRITFVLKGGRQIVLTRVTPDLMQQSILTA